MPTLPREPARVWVVIFAILICLTCVGMVLGIPMLVIEFSGRPARNTGWLIAGGVYAVLFLLIVSAGRNKTPAGTRHAASAPAAKSAGARPFKAGETIILKNHTLLVTDVQRNYQSPERYVHPQHDDHQFVVMHVVLKNVSSSKLPINPVGFQLEDDTGTMRSQSWITGLRDDLEFVTLIPGGQVEGNIGFEAKKDSKSLKLHYSGGISGGGEVVVEL
jgi:hypothetical protein